MAPKLIVLGWDSATFDVIDPLIALGRLPALASLQDQGFRAPLQSTWPPMTDCAWTTAFTGRQAGGHGIVGSWYRAPGQYSCRYFSSRDRKAKAVWEMAPQTRFLVWNVPMAFPPEQIDGVMVSGYGAPPGARFTAPESFQDHLARRWPLDDILDRAPHGPLEAFRADLLRGLEVQGEALVWAAKESGADCVLAVWPHVDRAQHFFWRYRGTSHPLASAVDDVYEAMDRATAKVLEAFPDAAVLVVSDHGAGPLHADVNVGAWLAAKGYAAYGRGRGAPLVRLAWGLPPSVRRAARRVAPGLARNAFAATLSGQLGPFDWEDTTAFVGFHGDLWLNLAGRERHGTVAEASAGEVLEEIAAALLAVQDPRTGEPVFAAVHRRADVFWGPQAHVTPDAVLDSWTTGYRVAPRRGPEGDVVADPSPLAGVEVAWSSDHRPQGVLAAGGPRVAAGRAERLDLFDLCPTVLALLGESIPEGLDGRARPELIAPSFLRRNPLRYSPARSGAPSGDRLAQGSDQYSAEEAEAVASHLKDLGYIE